MAKENSSVPSGNPCPKCGAMVPADRHYCKVCGERVRAVGEAVPAASPLPAPTMPPPPPPRLATPPANDPSQTVLYGQSPGQPGSYQAAYPTQPPPAAYPPPPSQQMVDRQIRAALAEDQKRRSVRIYRVLLYIVGYIFLFSAGLLFLGTNEDIVGDRMKPLTAEQIPALWLTIIGIAALGALFILLAMYSHRQPMKAFLYALILFISLAVGEILVSGRLNPVSVVVDFAVILFLIRGVQVGSVYQTMQKRGAGR